MMSLANRPLESIEAADLQALIENEVAESRTIEYKQSLPGNSRDDRKEFLADVSSFANASGGHLIYETFLSAQLDRPDSHIRNPRFVLQPGELPSLFPSLQIDLSAEVDLPDRTVARLLAYKPA